MITMWLQFQFKCQLQKKSVNLKLLSNVDHYSKAQLDFLEREFMRDGLHMKNEKIARAISRLYGAREVDKNDVRTWMANNRARQRKRPAEK